MQIRPCLPRFWVDGLGVERRGPIASQRVARKTRYPPCSQRAAVLPQWLLTGQHGQLELIGIAYPSEQTVTPPLTRVTLDAKPISVASQQVVAELRALSPNSSTRQLDQQPHFRCTPQLSAANAATRAAVTAAASAAASAAAAPTPPMWANAFALSFPCHPEAKLP